MLAAPCTELDERPYKNRYASAHQNEDWTIDQNWSSYTEEEHSRWNRLFARQLQLLPGRACDEALEAINRLELSHSGIPKFADLSEKLAGRHGLARHPRCRADPRQRLFQPPCQSMLSSGRLYSA